METKTKHALFETQKKKSHTHTHTGTVKPPLFGPRPPPIVRPRAREKATPPTPPRPLLGRVLSVFFFLCFLFVFCLFFVCSALLQNEDDRIEKRHNRVGVCALLESSVVPFTTSSWIHQPQTRKRETERKKRRKKGSSFCPPTLFLTALYFNIVMSPSSAKTSPRL